MSDTPRRDKIMCEIPDPRAIQEMIAFAGDMERENAELRKDKARLDWLIERGFCWRPINHKVPEFDGWYYAPHNPRAAIDAAMEESK